jgi:hypothetical protein
LAVLDPEQDMLISCMTRRPGTPSLASTPHRPGRGDFLIKVGGRPGIPVHVALTSTELALNDTNKRWGAATPPVAAAPAGTSR